MRPAPTAAAVSRFLSAWFRRLPTGTQAGRASGFVVCAVGDHVRVTASTLDPGQNLPMLEHYRSRLDQRYVTEMDAERRLLRVTGLRSPVS